MTARSITLLVFCSTLSALSLRASSRHQDGEELDLILNRLATYLLKYESELSTVVAEERYEQRETRRMAVSIPEASRLASVRTRKLESDVAFLRLPGGEAWFGVRDVKKVDGREVSMEGVRLLDVLQRLNANRLIEDGARIVAASAAHNLGSPRTINMPTTPLEVLHPTHHVQFIFKLRGRDKVDGAATRKVEFDEFDVPTIINDFKGEPLFIHGTAWVEPGNGRLWRVEMTIRPQTSVNVPRSFQNFLRVDFMLHQELGLMVPKHMYEEFFVIGGRGTGAATYSNYRRFTTAARLVPQN
jgi:hypothetical protein